MKAVILAAGRGKRLIPLTDVFPKPAVRINNKPLVLHNFNLLKKLGIADIGLVVGYKAEIVFERIGHGIDYGVELTYIHNEEWERGNGISLLKAKNFVGNEDFLLLMADHVFDEDILRELVNSRGKMVEGVAAGIASQKKEGVNKEILPEATKLLVNEKGEVLQFGKGLKEFNYIDIGAFICKPAVFLAETLEKEKQEVSVSDCMNWLISNNYKILAIDVTGKYWQDFDFIEDISRV